jgi:HK97 family phage portal protein
MGAVLDWMLGRENRSNGSVSTLANPSDEILDAFGAVPTMAGERVDVQGSLAIADVFAAVNIICETVAMLPLRVYREVAGEVEAAPDHRAAGMLASAPNPMVPAHRFWSTVAGNLLLWGNAFIEKLRDEDGLVTELRLLHPGSVTIEVNARLGRKRFVVYEEQGAVRRELDDDRVLHIFGVSSDGYSGLSPIRQCRQQLGLVKARERFEADVYASKPFLAGIINHPGRINDPVPLREQWRAVYGSGGTGRHGVAVLEEGATFQQLVAPLEDMQFLQSVQISRKTIANIFKLPAPYLNEAAGGSLFYQTVESNAIWFARNTIAPVTTNIQKFLNFDRGIFPFGSWYCEFVLEGLMRGDSKARADFYKTMLEVGAMFPDEFRRLENLPPRETAPPPAPLEAEE